MQVRVCVWGGHRRRALLPSLLLRARRARRSKPRVGESLSNNNASTHCARYPPPGCAGVYFEKYVKGKHAETLWVRNIQLGMYGVPLR